jgi:hypothetical protein
LTRNERLEGVVLWCSGLGFCCFLGFGASWYLDIAEDLPDFLRWCLPPLGMLFWVIAANVEPLIYPLKRTRAPKNSDPIAIEYKKQEASNLRIGSAIGLPGVALIILSIKFADHLSLGVLFTACIVGFGLAAVGGGIASDNPEPPEVLDIPDPADAPTSETFGSADWATPDDLERGDLL